MLETFIVVCIVVLMVLFFVGLAGIALSFGSRVSSWVQEPTERQRIRELEAEMAHMRDSARQALDALDELRADVVRAIEEERRREEQE